MGTVSIFRSDKLPCEIAIAGFLHAVYGGGVFHNGTSGPRTRNRRIVKDTVGSDIEKYVMDYSTHRWTARSIQEKQHNVASLSDEPRVSLVIRLADILEEFVDLGVSFSSKLKLGVPPDELDKTLLAAGNIAEQLAFPKMKSGFQTISDKAARFEPPDCLRTDWTRSITPRDSHTPYYKKER